MEKPHRPLLYSARLGVHAISIVIVLVTLVSTIIMIISVSLLKEGQVKGLTDKHIA